MDHSTESNMIDLQGFDTDGQPASPRRVARLYQVCANALRGEAIFIDRNSRGG
jgi:hypothetical protein